MLNTKPCYYYQQGSCRFGNSCRFSHEVPGAPRGAFNYGASTGSATTTFSYGAPAASATTTKETKDFVDSLVSDMKGSVEAKMWPLSCYGRGGISCPGFEDVSSEEMRLKAYESMPNNWDAYTSQIAQELQAAQQRKQLVVTRNPETIKVITDHVSQQAQSAPSAFGASKTTNPFSAPSVAGSGTGSSLFGNPSGSLFGASTASPKSVFGSSTTPSSSLFGPTSSDSKSAFGSAVPAAQSVFGAAAIGPTSVFGTAATNPSSVFGSASVDPKSVFGSASVDPKSVFGSAPVDPKSVCGSAPPADARSVFGPAASSSTAGPFGGGSLLPTPSSVFGVGQPAASSTNTSSLFATAPSAQSVFGTAASSGAANAVTPASVFGTTATTAGVPPSGGSLLGTSSAGSIFGSSQTQTPAGSSLFGQSTQGPRPSGILPGQIDSAVYSDMNSLTAQDLAAYRADSFELGKIPIVPPPKEIVSGG